MIPRDGTMVTRPSISSRFNASRTGVRPMPSCALICFSDTKLRGGSVPDTISSSMAA
ncbi:hypothetical protein [Azospirillum sp. TSA6c]|uniref:hypothetical protein n=1 Tax=Azospirillum sp. TSA6c TaxID=709813 RepID=UPI0013049C1A|nr:hypothetical protein [Azospirillum sp. TSA6c]